MESAVSGNNSCASDTSSGVGAGQRRRVHQVVEAADSISCLRPKVLENRASSLGAKVLVQECVVAAVLAFFKKRQKDKPNSSRGQADGPE